MRPHNTFPVTRWPQDDVIWCVSRLPPPARTSPSSFSSSRHIITFTAVCAPIILSTTTVCVPQSSSPSPHQHTRTTFTTVCARITLTITTCLCSSHHHIITTSSLPSLPSVVLHRLCSNHPHHLQSMPQASSPPPSPSSASVPPTKVSLNQPPLRTLPQTTSKLEMPSHNPPCARCPKRPRNWKCLPTADITFNDCS
jgi:hypothetical protein